MTVESFATAGELNLGYGAYKTHLITLVLDETAIPSDGPITTRVARSVCLVRTNNIRGLLK